LEVVGSFGRFDVGGEDLRVVGLALASVVPSARLQLLLLSPGVALFVAAAGATLARSALLLATGPGLAFATGVFAMSSAAVIAFAAALPSAAAVDADADAALPLVLLLCCPSFPIACFDVVGGFGEFDLDGEALTAVGFALASVVPSARLQLLLLL
jgi:hypothetical protein